ncbi:hypothetical protein G4B88_012109 [Cannabis sativa]|uniref:Uncharacterized protein n=1 Tax=Cannabis sativa TaxID=3483 RepID=A0A7J6F1E1_CANSA|nr:hypothetical protein G4B88_012109 [Cannabis sativa]
MESTSDASTTIPTPPNEHEHNLNLHRTTINDLELTLCDHHGLMTKTILTTELPCIPRAITPNTSAKSKVTIKSLLSVIDQIKNWLTKSDQDVFKHYSQFGRLLDLDTKGLFLGTLVNQIILRMVDCQKRHEL